MSATSSQFGRVADDGTVFVTTADGERAVGQIPDASPEDALAFYVNRYEGLAGQVSLLVARVLSGTLTPTESRQRISSLSDQIKTANAVGDLAGLVKQLSELDPIIAQQAETRKAERARQIEEAKAAKESMVTKAEALAEGTDWRHGADKFRALLEEWKALPRIDKATDEDLWHRFSVARTSYTRKRKAQFAQVSEQREIAKGKKIAIIADARELASSTEWGKAAGGFRELMERWKAAGSAPHEDDEKLWKEFRAIQDEFFAAKQVAISAMDSEFNENLEKKVALLDEAEANILPVTDLNAAKNAFRTFLESFHAIGRIPRDQMRTIDSRVKALENAVRSAEDDEWRRTDPQARSRAEDTVSMLSTEIEKLNAKIEKAEARGDTKAADKARESIRTYETWLKQAEATLEEFSR